MVKKEVQGDVQLGTDPYNVADGFTKLKILKLLYQLDIWDTVAQFGTENLDEDIQMDLNQINKRRVEGLERFISTLRQLIGNTHFAMRKEDITKVDAYLLRIKTAEETLSSLYTVEKEDRINDEVFEINEILFHKILLILRDVKDKMNVPLNKAGLIFRQSEEMDLDKMMEEFASGG